MPKNYLSLRIPLLVTFLVAIGIGFGHHKSLALNPPLDEFASISTPTGFSIDLEIADTVDKRATGLMFRKSLEADRGMLFIFPEMGFWTFWMKNTLIPLDILWMDESWKILHVESQVPICTQTDDSCPRYYSTQESRYVLEIQAGMAKELGLTPGKRLSITLPGKQATQ